MGASPAYTPDDVARSFTGVYYQVAEKMPHRLPELYGKDSALSHGDVKASGTEQIGGVIGKLPLSGVSAAILSVDVQATGSGAYVVVVVGSVPGNGKDSDSSSLFSQTFVLERQCDSHDEHFYCRNDVFRLIPKDRSSAKIPEIPLLTKKSVDAKSVSASTSPDRILPTSTPIEVKEKAPNGNEVKGKKLDDNEVVTFNSESTSFIAASEKMSDDPVSEANHNEHNGNSIDDRTDPVSEHASMIEDQNTSMARDMKIEAEPEEFMRGSNEDSSGTITEGSKAKDPMSALKSESAVPPKPAAPKTWASIVSTRKASEIAGDAAPDTAVLSFESAGSSHLSDRVADVNNIIVPVGQGVTEGEDQGAFPNQGGRNQKTVGKIVSLDDRKSIGQDKVFTPRDGTNAPKSYTAGAGTSTNFQAFNGRNQGQQQQMAGDSMQVKHGTTAQFNNQGQHWSGGAEQGYYGHRQGHMRVFGPTVIVPLGPLGPERRENIKELVYMFRAEFSQYGYRVRHVDIKDAKGLAFIEYDTIEGVQAAVAAWADGPRSDGKFAGIPLSVTEKRPWQNKRPGNVRNNRGSSMRGGRRGRPVAPSGTES